MVPGFIDVQVTATTKLLIRAGGALAVFVIVFFFNPARLAAHEGPSEDTGIADDADLTQPPNPPTNNRNGVPLSPENRAAFFMVWKVLLKLDRAGEDLWNEVSNRTIRNFTDRLIEVRDCIADNALFFSEDTYNSLERIIRAANFYLDGKITLLDIRGSLPPSGGGKVTTEIQSQIEQNKRWLTRYRTLLRNIRLSFHRKVTIESEEPLVGRVTPL